MSEERAGLPSTFGGWHVYWSDGKGEHDRFFGPHESGLAWAFYAERAAECKEWSKRETAKRGMSISLVAYINVVVD